LGILEVEVIGFVRGLHVVDVNVDIGPQCVAPSTRLGLRDYIDDQASLGSAGTHLVRNAVICVSVTAARIVRVIATLDVRMVVNLWRIDFIRAARLCRACVIGPP